MSEKLPENVDSIGRIKFLMEYDVSNSIYENTLLEQLTYNQTLAKQAGFGPVSAKKADELVNQGKVISPKGIDFKDMISTDPMSKFRQAVYSSGNQELRKEKYGTVDLPSTDIRRIYSRENKLHKMDAHDWFTMFQLLMIGGAVFTGGLTSVALFIVAAVAELAEAVYFWKVDKDPYMAVIMAIFAVIPDGGLLEIPGISKIIQKRGVEGIKQLVRKNKQGLPLTPDEIIDLNFFNEQILINKKRLQVLFRNQLKNKLKLYIAGKSPKWIMNFLLMIRPIKEPIKIGGSLIAFDYLYAYIFRDDIEKMEIRNKNVLLNMARYVKNLLSGKIPLAQDLLAEVDEGLDETFDKIEKGEMNYDGFSMPNENPQFDKIIK